MPWIHCVFPPATPAPDPQRSRLTYCRDLLIALTPSLCPTQFILNPLPEWLFQNDVIRSPHNQEGPMAPSCYYALSSLHKPFLVSYYVSDTFLATVQTLAHNENQVPALTELMCLKNTTDTKQVNRRNIKITLDNAKCQEENREIVTEGVTWGGLRKAGKSGARIYPEAGIAGCQGHNMGSSGADPHSHLLWEVSPAHQGNKPPLLWVTKAQWPYSHVCACQHSQAYLPLTDDGSTEHKNCI